MSLFDWLKNLFQTSAHEESNLKWFATIPANFSARHDEGEEVTTFSWHFMLYADEVTGQKECRVSHSESVVNLQKTLGRDIYSHKRYVNAVIPWLEGDCAVSAEVCSTYDANSIYINDRGGKTVKPPPPPNPTKSATILKLVKKEDKEKP